MKLNETKCRWKSDPKMIKILMTMIINAKPDFEEDEIISGEGYSFSVVNSSN